MIDLHSHLLPAIDDGARTIQDSVDLAYQAMEQGVTHMVCTPHIHPRVFNNDIQNIRESFEQTLVAFREKGIELKLSFACEVRLSIEVSQWIAQNKLPFLGDWNDKSALLLELPHSHVPVGADTLIKWLLKKGIQPIIPHPERNREVMADYSKASWLKGQGALFQATAGAFLGSFGEQAEQIAWRLLDDDLITYVASDMHNLSKRPNQMMAAYEKIQQLKGDDIADELFFTVPQKITQNTQWH